MKDTSQGAAALRTIELDQRLGGTPVQVDHHISKSLNSIYGNLSGASGAREGANPLHSNVWRQDDRLPGGTDQDLLIAFHQCVILVGKSFIEEISKPPSRMKSPRIFSSSALFLMSSLSLSRAVMPHPLMGTKGRMLESLNLICYRLILITIMRISMKTTLFVTC